MLEKNLADFAVLPCRRNSKIPATPHGLSDASFEVNVEELTNKGYNIGIACSKSGVIALDLDYHSEDSRAEEELKELEVQLNSVLPRTLTQTTASGNGKHLIFSSKGIVNPKGKLSKNIDIRYNGYIMFAPSVIDGQQYQIVDGIDENGEFVIATLPDSWLDFINKRSVFKQKSSKIVKNVSAPPKKRYNINIDEMFYLCYFLYHCRKDAAILSEPEWFSMISVLAPIDGSDEVIHEVSRPYSNYSYEETQKKIDNARKFGHGHTCAYIASCFPEVCGNCPFYKGGA